MSDGRLFISHANEDEAVVSRIVSFLEAHGAPCWISSRDIAPRAIYADAITEAMQAASACVVIMSAASSGSKAVKRELELASHYDKPFIPIRIDATEPAAGLDYYLRNTQWVDYGGDGERALDRIVAEAAPSTNATPPASPAQSQSQSLSGGEWRTLAIIGVVLAVFAGIGVYLLQRGQTMQAETRGFDLSLLAGSYNWEGVTCENGPQVSIDNNQLVFAMTGQPTYRHDVVGGDGVSSFETRVAEPEDHRGETYTLSLGSSGLSVATNGRTDQWIRCNVNEAAEP